MKKTKVFLPLTLSLLSLNLTSCAKTLNVKNYSLSAVKSQYGYRFAEVDVAVNDGVIESVSLEETYSPCTWARLSAEAVASLGEENVVPVEGVTLEDGNTVTLNFAKYIQVCGDVWVGKERDKNDTYYSNCEYIQYSSTTSSDEVATDLMRYLNVKDSGTYQFASRVGKYYSDVVNSEIKIMKSKDDKTYEATSITPYFPNEKCKRSENDSDWKSSIDALCTYLKGKKLNFNKEIRDKKSNRYDSLKIKDGEWTFNPTLVNYAGSSKKEVEAQAKDENNYEKIEGCKSSVIDLTSLNGYFEAINNAFASVEYQSKY